MSPSLIPTEVKVTNIDFSQTSLAQPYSHFYAKVIDNLFTPTDCTELLELAESSDVDPWIPAGLSAAQPGKVYFNFRNSDRVLVFNASVASKIYQKLLPYVSELRELRPDGPLAEIAGKVGSKQAPTWVLVGVNERLSFLRYRPGQYFKSHCDGLVEVGPQKSFITLHLYLNDSTSADDPISSANISDSTHPSIPIPSSPPLPTGTESTEFIDAYTSSPELTCGVNEEPLEGGATRFWTPNKKAYMDVFPKLGRVLIFQQRMLVHSGEAVMKGIKYTMRSDLMFEKKF